MPEKNDGIFLWMLEQNRQRSKHPAFKEETVQSEEQLSSATRELIFAARNSEQEIRQSLPDEPDGLEQLLREQADLNKEFLRLDKEEKELSLRVKELSEKVVQEIRKRNDSKRSQISQLQAKISKMELALGELSVSSSVGENTVGNAERESAKPMDSDSPRKSLDSGDCERIVEIVKEGNDTRYRFALKHKR